MADENHESEASRELRLEGATLFIACGALVALLAGAFMVGRWFEKRTQPRQVVNAGEPGPLDPVVHTEPPLDTSGNLTFFDDPASRGQQPEPARQMERPAGEAAEPPAAAHVDAEPRRAPEPLPEAAAAPSAEDPAYYVQVFAGRDRESAVGLVDRLQTQGYEVRMYTQREGPETLFKVRVGGYETQDLARSKAVELQKAGYAGAFVARSS